MLELPDVYHLVDEQRRPHTPPGIDGVEADVTYFPLRRPQISTLVNPNPIVIQAFSENRIKQYPLRIQKGPTNLTATGSVMGTLAFMAPEQRASAKQTDARADIYSIGATLYTLATNETSMDLFAAELDDDLLEGLHPVLGEVVLTACSYQPNQRYRTVALLRTALEDLLPKLPPLARTTPPLITQMVSYPDPPERPQRFATPSLNVAAAVERAHTLAPQDDRYEPARESPSYVAFDTTPIGTPADASRSRAARDSGITHRHVW